MSKGKRVRDEVPEKILKRHNEIRAVTKRCSHVNGPRIPNG